MKLLKIISNFIFLVRYKSSDHKKFRSYITNFYDHYNDTQFSFNSFRITKCRFYEYPKRFIIEIHSLSPGMIIGPRGRHIDDFKAYMQKRYSKPIEIKLEETNPFK
jgi:ribosomal protein S3